MGFYQDVGVTLTLKSRLLAKMRIKPKSTTDKYRCLSSSAFKLHIMSVKAVKGRNGNESRLNFDFGTPVASPKGDAPRTSRALPFGSRSWGKPRQMLHLGRPQDRTGSPRPRCLTNALAPLDSGRS